MNSDQPAPVREPNGVPAPRAESDALSSPERRNGAPPAPLVALRRSAGSEAPGGRMKLVELQRAVRAVEPAAVLVAPRILERVIRQVCNVPALAWEVPHRRSFVVDRHVLFRHVEQEELDLDPEHLLPPTVILLARPTTEVLNATGREELLLKYWRRLFHASVHLALAHRATEGNLSATEERERIAAVGACAFAEVRRVLDEEGLLPPAADDSMVYREFAACYLELRYFAPHLLGSFFPGLRDRARIDALLARDLDAGPLFARTRLAGAPEPTAPAEGGPRSRTSILAS